MMVHIQLLTTILLNNFCGNQLEIYVEKAKINLKISEEGCIINIILWLS